ncbi:MAG: patatin-like phospholipase family protein, partial [Anaerolineales bacterium]|nr:patatin-like phospholipase family protein [Anaerolineales bacterium]
MKPFRKNVAIAIDGGGIKGIIVTKALSMIEEHLSLPVKDIFHLTAGTSTGSVIAAGIAAGMTAQDMYDLYTTLGNEIFKPSWRTKIWPLVRYKYPAEPLEDALTAYVGELKMGEFWEKEPATDVVITTFDLVENRTRFIKPWKKSYRDWPVVKAVMASCTVPTYFPIVEGRFVDGGVGSYSNPCYL